MNQIVITSKERSALRSAAHDLNPVVLIGDKGLTQAVLQEIEVHLNAHELIKVKVSGKDKAQRNELLENICTSLNCAPIHHLGHILILYRPKPE